MRYDRRIQLIRYIPGRYNPETGNHEGDSEERTDLYASVMDTGMKTMQIVYGAIRQGSLTLHVQNHIVTPFDRIEFDGRIYRVDTRRKLRTKEALIVSEVQK